MKRVFMLFLLTLLASFVTCSKGNDLIASSLSQIAINFYANRSENFDVIVFENEPSSLSEIVNEVTKNFKFSTRIIKLEALNENESKINYTNLQEYEIDKINAENRRNLVRLNQSAILLFKTAKYFEYFLTFSTLYDNYSKNFHFTLYVEEKVDFLRIRSLNSTILYFSSLLQVNSLKIYLVGFETFQWPNCREWNTKVVNNFNNTTQKWTKLDFFITHFDDCQECKLTIAFVYPQPFVFEINIEENNKIEGYGKIFIEEIASKINLRIKYYPIQVTSSFRVIQSDYDILTYASSMRQVEALARNGKLYNAFATESHGFCLHQFSSIDIVVLVSEPELYTQFEKIVLPFEIEVWIWLLVSLSVGISTIFLLKFTPKHTQKFVFGMRVKTPTINLL